MRALVAGWFSLAAGGATAGDVIVRDVVCEWLRERRVDHDVAQPPALGTGVDWFRVAPESYTDFVFVCGPVGPELAVRELIERFAPCRRVAVNVSVVGDPAWRPFDVLIERDSEGSGRPDLALGAAGAPAPLVAVVRTHRQLEYRGSRPEEAHAAFGRLLKARAAAPFEVDTVLDCDVPGRRTAAEVRALLGRADVVLTTRLHGLVLALAQGVPALAVDSAPGGAKVLRQARALDWPAVMCVDRLDEEELAQKFDWCLTREGRARARAAVRVGARDRARIRAQLTGSLRR